LSSGIVLLFQDLSAFLAGSFNVLSQTLDSLTANWWKHHNN